MRKIYKCPRCSNVFNGDTNKSPIILLPLGFIYAPMMCIKHYEIVCKNQVYPDNSLKQLAFVPIQGSASDCDFGYLVEVDPEEIIDMVKRDKQFNTISSEQIKEFEIKHPRIMDALRKGGIERLVTEIPSFPLQLNLDFQTQIHGSVA